jgi:uncharacterized protein DUF1569
MPTLFDASTRSGVHARIGSLEATRSGLWGKMNAPQMVCHCADQLRVALGDVPTELKPVPALQSRLVRQALIYWLPVPKGKISTAPEMQATKPAGWEGDLAALHGLVDRFAERRPDGDWAPHPAFGRLTGKEWGALCYKHLDHHLRQFGA